MDQEAKKEELKERISEFFSVNYKTLLIALLVFAFLVRLYYFILTKSQPVWWDEAEYLLKAKSIALGTPDTGFWEGRPILFPIMLSAFYFIGLGEISIRFFLIIISFFSVYLVYLVGKQLFSEKIGLISAFLYSLVYINLFYTVRVMVDIPHVFLGLLAFYFFFTKKKKLVWLSVPLIALATLTRFPAVFFFVILFVYIAFTERMKALKNKDYWISLVLGFLVGLPYLIWANANYGDPLYAIKLAGGGAVSGISLSSGLSVLKQYLATFPSYLGTVSLILFIFGLTYFLIYTILGFDLVLKNNKSFSSKFLVLIWILIPLLYFGFGVSHFEDRYIFMAFPAMFFIIALALGKLQESITKYSKPLAAILIILLLAFSGFQLIKGSDEIIKSRLDSFGPVKEAGIWIKQNTNPQDIIMTRSHPPNTYYSERASYSISAKEEDFAANYSIYKPKYLVISVFDAPNSNEWQWAFSINQQKYGLTPVKAFPENNPALIIYKTSF